MTRILRILPVVLAGLCLVAAVGAQTIVVTGTGLHGQNGLPVANGTITWTPVQTPGGAAVSFRLLGGGQYAGQSVPIPIRSGFFSLVVPDVSLTIPGNIGFHVVAKDNNSGAIVLDDPFVQPSSAPSPSPAASWCSTTGGVTTCNLDKYDKTIQILPLFAAVVGSSSVGTQGPQGIAGAQGPAGPQGSVGAAGAAGPQGLQGLTGPAGAAGMSAYALAVAGGFSGTQGQWLTSLIGPAGPQGAAGATGPQGPVGPTGPPGSSGSGGYATAVAASSGALPTAIANCTGGNCFLAVPQTYPASADSSGINIFRFHSAPGVIIQSAIGNGLLYSMTDPTAAANGLAGVGLGVDLQNISATYDQHALQVNQRVITAGADLGNTGTCPAGSTLAGSCPQGWLTTQGMYMTVNANNAGITGGFDMFLAKHGIGDVHNYWYVTGEGGFRGASDEMLQMRALSGGESANPVYTGTVASTSGYTVKTTPVTGGGTQGVGRMLIDTSAPIALNAYITAQGVLLNAASQPLPVSTLTLAGLGTALTPTHCLGTLAASITTVPYIPSTGANTIATSTAFTLNLIQGAGCAVGDLLNFAGDFHETATVTAVGAVSSGHQSVTAALRHTHSAGSVVMQSSFGAGGLEVLANDSGGFRYVLDVLGATSSSQIAVVAFQGAGSAVVNLYNAILLTFYSMTSGLSNTGGVVSLSFYPSDVQSHPQLQSYSQITISGAANAAFNGPCTNLTANAFTGAATCTQAASTGQTSAGSTAIALGDTPAGNTRINLFPLAEVLDIQNRAAVGADVLDGTLRLEPNAMPLNVGDTVEEPHDYAAGYVASAVGFGFANVYAAQFSSIEDPGVGGGGINGSVHARYTRFVNPCSMYAGCGGNLSTPKGYEIGGMAAGFGGMDLAPWPSNSDFTHAGCDPLTGNCSSPVYHYSIFHGAGYQGHDVKLDWHPFLQRLDLNAPNITISQIADTSSPVKGACFVADPQGQITQLARCALGTGGGTGGTGIADVQSTTPTNGNPIAATSCGGTVTVTMPNMLTTSVFTARPSTDVSATTGWTPSDAVYVQTWPTAGYGNYKLCNRGSSPASPAAIVLNLGAQ